jgi:hypothetical protein
MFRRVAAAAFVGGLLVVGASAASSLSLFPFHTQRSTSALSGHVTSVVFRGDVGDLLVSPGPAAVTTVSQWNLIAPTVTETVAGGVLTVVTTCPNEFPENDCAVDVTITLPPAVAVRATNAVGSITTRGLVGDEMLSTAVGDITVDGVRASRVAASASTGRVHAVLLDAPTDARLSSDTGDVAVTVPVGAYRLTTSSDIGDVTVTGVTNQPDSPHHLLAKTDTGDITVTGR